MKKSFAILFFACSLSLFSAAQPDAVKQYINTYKELAINEEIRTGVPAAITLAQGILESDAGRSDLSLSSNNHFGIKCKNDWTGATVYHDDDVKNECFRSYPTVADSYRDHSDFLKSRPNYAFLFQLAPTDYQSWAHGLKQAGYATSSVYGDMLIKEINDYGLEEYTEVALDRMKNGNHEDVAMNHANEDAYSLNDHQNAGPSAPSVNTEIPDGNYPQGEFTINQTKVIYANAGASLFALAANHNIAYKKLLDYNELDKTDILDKDQLIFLEKKPKKSITKDYHVVAASETIEDIAQKEGVQLQSLYEYNKMQKGLEPAVGEKVYLRPGKPSYYPKLLAKRK
jgi:LysM repeat protein